MRKEVIVGYARGDVLDVMYAGGGDVLSVMYAGGGDVLGVMYAGGMMCLGCMLGYAGIVMYERDVMENQRV